MKSYKDRVLAAQLDLIRRYQENDPPEVCPFCEIYPGSQVRCCDGCFMADEFGQPGCMRFYSSLDSTCMQVVGDGRRTKRASFHIRLRKILLKRDPKYFTPRGWEFLDIPKSW